MMQWKVLFLLQCTLLLPYFIQSNIFTNPIFRRSDPSKNLQTYLTMRAGEKNATGPTFWHYSGLIRNPETGKTVAGIEGLEMVKRCGLLGYLTKKVFIYTESLNHSTPLVAVRVRPFSPLRKVQPTKIMNEYVSFAPGKFSNYTATIEWPGGRKLTNRNLELTPRSRDKSIFFESLDSIVGNKEFTVVNFMRPWRGNVSRWISFAGPVDGGRSQEFYTIVAKSGRTFMHFKRYGECPSWCGVGKRCSTEITATRFDSFDELPSTIIDFFSRACPKFDCDPSSCTREAFDLASDDLDKYTAWYSHLNPFGKHSLFNRFKKRTTQLPQPFTPPHLNPTTSPEFVEIIKFPLADTIDINIPPETLDNNSQASQASPEWWKKSPE